MKLFKRIICIIFAVFFIASTGIAAYAASDKSAGSGKNGIYIQVWAWFTPNKSTYAGKPITKSRVRLVEGDYDSNWIYDKKWTGVYNGRRAFVQKFNNPFIKAKGYWNYFF